MANADSPHGLIPLDAVLRARYYRITNNYGTALFIFDPVVMVANGTIEKAAAGATNPIAGVIIGIYKQMGAKTGRPESLFPVQYFAASPGTTYDYWALVADHPDQTFVCQADDNGGSLTNTEVNANANLIFTHAGNTYSGVSGVEINGSSAGTDATYQLTLLGLHNVYDPAAYGYNTYGAYAKWRVQINLHQLRHGIAGV